MLMVTGGAGFIGSNFVHEYIKQYHEPVLVIDKLTYAANKANLIKPEFKQNIIFHEGDIGNTEFMFDMLLGYRVSSVINFAAESHVDRSINNSSPFIDTNIVGTESFLHAASLYYDGFRKRGQYSSFKFLHVSTDEVYGSLSFKDQPSTEDSPYKPRSIYAASKAASDHIAMAYYHTHGLPVIITACSNNYGPHQHTEKFIPTVISKALRNEKVPVYGTGENIRDWIYVTDHCDALMKVLRWGGPGMKYNIGGYCQISNENLAKIILELMGKSSNLIEYVADRKGHDLRYDLNCSRMSKDFGWLPRIDLGVGLKKTIEWYTKEYNNEQNLRSNTSGWEIVKTVSGDTSNNQTTFADLRQTIDILSTDHINAGRD